MIPAFSRLWPKGCILEEVKEEEKLEVKVEIQWKSKIVVLSITNSCEK